MFFRKVLLCKLGFPFPLEGKIDSSLSPPDSLSADTSWRLSTACPLMISCTSAVHPPPELVWSPVMAEVEGGAAPGGQPALSGGSEDAQPAEKRAAQGDAARKEAEAAEEGPATDGGPRSHSAAVSVSSPDHFKIRRFFVLRVKTWPEFTVCWNDV